MEKEIEEIIKKNLPEQVGQVLKERLSKADKDEMELVKYKQWYEDKNKEIQKLNTIITEYNALDARNAGLVTRELDVADKERMLEVTILKVQLEESNKRASIIQEHTALLVRNTNFREHIYDNERKDGYYDSKTGQWVEGTNTTKTYNKDITKD